MRKHILLPALTAAFGAAGLALRQLQLHCGFDASGLPVSGSVFQWALPLCTLLFLLCLTLALAGLRGKVPALTYDEAFRRKNCSGYMTAVVLCAALLLAGLPLSCLAYLRHELPNPVHLVLALLMAACGWGLILLGRSNYRDLGQGRYSGRLLLPAYTGALWLILSYQQVSGDPILQNYIYRLLAIIFILLTFYFMAGFAFEKGRPLVTLWVALGAVYFCLVTLLDDQDWRTVAYLAAFALYSAVHSIVLLYNLTVEREESTDE